MCGAYGTYGTYRGEDKYIECFGWETCKKQLGWPRPKEEDNIKLCFKEIHNMEYPGLDTPPVRTNH